MTIGQIGMKHPSLAGMVVAMESRISRVALHHRFSSAATAFLLKCLGFVLHQKVSCPGELKTEILQHFKRVLIVDSSSWDVNESLRMVLPGSGGAASEASCKLQAVYDYKHGEFQFLDVTAGIKSDNRYTDYLPALLNKGDLILFDLGYFKLSTLATIAAKDAFFLARLLIGTGLQDPTTLAPIDLAGHLAQLKADFCEIEVLMRGRDKTANVNCRLVALRVSDQVAAERRRKLKASSKKNGCTTSDYHLQMCNWTLLITNIPSLWLPLKMVRAVYMVRWQIELIFKQLKSILRIHQSNTTKEHRLRCELYGKLIGAVIIHRIHAAETNRLWNTQRREVSMEKFHKRIQERAFTFFRLLLTKWCVAIEFLRTQINRIIPACLKYRQKSRASSLDILEAQFDPKLFSEITSRRKCAP